MPADTTTRKKAAVWHATYRGDVTPAVGEVIGRSPFGEPLVVVDAEPLETGSTRLGFAIATSPDVDAVIARRAASYDLVDQHPTFFGGGSL